MNKFEQFVLSTEEEKLKLIKAENPAADDEQVKEHVEKLEEFISKMLTTSRQAKEPCPEKIGFMTQDIHVKNIESIAEELKKTECKEVKINKED